MMKHMDIKAEIAKIVTRGADGNFTPVDLSLEGVNRWRASMGLAPLTKTALTGQK